MKKLITALLLVLLNVSAGYGQEWLVDFSEAKEIAANENKPIVLVFQGSDWCAPCIKLDREIWSTDGFKKYAQDHFVMLQVDFPRRKQNTLSETQASANAALAERYNTKGVFPFVVVLDKDGNVLGETSYKKISPIAYAEELSSFLK